MAAITYDTKCQDLAEAFLSDEPDLRTAENTKDLAQLIQITIEDFIEAARRDWSAANGQFGVGA